MNRAFTVTAIVATMILAGCLGSQTGTQQKPAGREAKRLTAQGGFTGELFGGSVDTNRVAVDNYDFSKAIDATHGGVPGAHNIRSLHTGSHALELVGYDPLVAGKDPTAYDSGFGGLDVWDDGVHYYASTTHFAGNGGTDIVDVTDPAHPKVLSHIYSGMVNSDSQFTDDGNYLFLAAYTGATQASGLHDVRSGLRAFPVPVAGLYDAAADGVTIWDVHDKSNPKFVLFYETANGNEFHNMFTVTIDGKYYMLTTYPTTANQYNIYQFVPEGGGKLVGVAKTPYMTHDLYVYRHPITGDWLLLTGKGQGIGIFNINDPSHPVEIGEWAAEKGATGWHRQNPLPQLVNGRALVIVAGETGGGASLPYAVLDITDPTAPQLLSQWQIPGKPNSNEPNFYTFSPHELDTWNGYVVSGNYHAGVWLFDAGNLDRMMAPVTLGYYLPHEEPALHGAPQNPPFAFNPDTWGAYFDDRGYIYTADWGSGLYILKFAATNTWTPPASITHNNG